MLKKISTDKAPAAIGPYSGWGVPGRGAGSGLLSGGGSSDRRDSCRTLRSGNRVLGG